jgi:hypothetical protein
MSSDNVLTQRGGARHEVFLMAREWVGLGQSANETAGCAFTRVPTRGFQMELKEPCGALPHTCLVVYLFTAPRAVHGAAKHPSVA